MKKIGVLTINDYSNYGNRLQNYAVQEVLKTLGCSVETVVNNTSLSYQNNHNRSIKYRINNLKKKSGRELIELILNYLNRSKIRGIKNEKVAAFKKFTSLYISETEYSISESNVPNNLSERFDFFTTGSDQVWNPNYRKGSSIDFLAFAPEHKRIAYAPSFGISTIPTEYIESYKKWLFEMGSLSVREEAGAKIIKELTGKDAVVLVDPTLMLTSEKWFLVAKQSTYKPKGKYLLTYFLGKQSNDVINIVKKTAYDHNLEIVNLADIKDVGTYITGPSEFIDYIKSSTIFFTDSFHGAVFSILFEKAFIIFDRSGMNSRTETLLSTFKLNSRRWDSVKDSNDIFNVDFTHVASILENERNRAQDYLREALHIKENI